MSDSAQELLGRVLGALAAGPLANALEVRRYLERVLHDDDAETWQKAKAWLYLSRIEDDPAKRRECFETALTLDPGNAEAHQGLAILDGRLKIEDITDPNKPLQPVIPNAELLTSGARRLACPKCGAKMLIPPGEQASKCSYCGTHLEGDPGAANPAVVREQDFFAALPTAKAHRWEYPTERTLRCEGCGATFVLPSLQMSGACPFCGSTHVINESAAELIQPDAILPFRFDQTEASSRIRNWIERERFRPANLASCAGMVEPRSAFLPFWTFDLGGTMDWRALVREGRGNNWVPQTGVHLVYYDDLLVPASRCFPEELSGAYADFNTNALVPYSAELLAGYVTEIYQVPLAEASVAARQRALQAAKEYEQMNSLAGRTYRDFVMNSAGMVVDSFKLVLLPLWLSNYRYRDQTFPVAVNGQTGAVAGRIPRNLLQRALVNLFSG